MKLPLEYNWWAQQRNVTFVQLTNRGQKTFLSKNCPKLFSKNVCPVFTISLDFCSLDCVLTTFSESISLELLHDKLLYIIYIYGEIILFAYGNCVLAGMWIAFKTMMQNWMKWQLWYKTSTFRINSARKMDCKTKYNEDRITKKWIDC